MHLRQSGARGANSSECNGVAPPRDKTIHFAGQVHLFARQKLYQRLLPHMNFSAHSGVDYLFGALVFDLASSVAL